MTSVGERQALPGLSVVVPVFNGRSSLTPLAQALEEVLPSLAGEFELILVDDGSRDDSWAVVQALVASRPWVRGIALAKNYGQHNALLCGIRAARFELTATLDDDLQHPPGELAKLIARLGAGFDIVYGTPEVQPHGFWRSVSSRVTKKVLSRAMGAETAGMVSAFRIFRTRLRDGFCTFTGPFVSIDVLLTWATSRFGYVRTRHEPRRYGVSNYGFQNLVRHALNMLTGFSVLPLQLASLMGLVTAAFGVCLLVWVLGSYAVLGFSAPGFPFLASTLIILSGVQLIALGVIGEYLARMHFRLMQIPSYVIREDSETHER